MLLLILSMWQYFHFVTQYKVTKHHPLFLLDLNYHLLLLQSFTISTSTSPFCDATQGGEAPVVVVA